MKLTILGSRSSIIDEKRKGPSFLLDAGKLLMFDCGWGSGEQVLRAGHEINKIDHIFISHPHADHLGNLIPILLSMHNSSQFFPEQKRKKPLYLHGYKGFKKDYGKLRRILFPERAERYKVRLIEYGNTKKNYDGFRVESRLVRHVPEYFHAVSFRVDRRGKSFVYSGDCGYDKNLIKLAEGADLALLETSVSPKMFRELGPRPNHLSPYECGIIAKKAGVKKIVLMHLYDNVSEKEITAEARKNFSGEIIIAKDLKIIKI